MKASILSKDGKPVIGRTLSHYKITDKLNGGGMGVVYRAWDTLLNREAAIKVLTEDLVVADPDSRHRFIQEAQATAALDHPYIATIYEIGEADGVTFIVMELIRGNELSDVIRTGRLDAERALEHAVEVTEALAFAHDKGIIHRDLKPSNIMVTDEGHTKIIDFGLAKLTRPLPTFEDGDDTAVRTPSRSDFVKGTLAYMSPEQARGRPLDLSSDVFSLAIVLHEMLTGANPFLRGSSLETAHAIIHDEPPTLADSENVPANVAALLQPLLSKCLAKDPKDRFQSARALHAALKDALRQLESARFQPYRTSSEQIPLSGEPGRGKMKWIGAIVAILILILTLAIAIPIIIPRGNVSVAVLGTAGDLAPNNVLDQLFPLALDRRLRDFEGLTVTPFVVSGDYDGGESLETALAKLNTAWVIHGELRADTNADGVVADVHLVDREATEAKGWPRTFEADNRVDLADEVSRAVAASLDVEPVAPPRPTSTEALEAYLRGKAHLLALREAVDFEAAEEAFLSSIAADDEFAPSQAGLAIALWERYDRTHAARLVDRAEAAANQAVMLDANFAVGHLALGIVQLGRGETVEAQGSFEEALELAPRDDGVRRRIAETYAKRSRLDDAEEMYQSAIDLRPTFFRNPLRKGLFHLYLTGERDEALWLLAEAIKLSPDGIDTLQAIAAAADDAGERDKAEKLSRAIAEIRASDVPRP